MARAGKKAGRDAGEWERRGVGWGKGGVKLQKVKLD